MNKFSKMLSSSSKEIRGARAAFLSEDVKASQETLIRNLEEELRGLNRQLIDATDLYPDSELTLMVTRKDFNPAKWTEKIQALKLAIIDKKEELDVAKETYNEWFSELPASPKKEKKDKEESK